MREILTERFHKYRVVLFCFKQDSCTFLQRGKLNVDQISLKNDILKCNYSTVALIYYVSIIVAQGPNLTHAQNFECST